MDDARKEIADRVPQQPHETLEHPGVRVWQRDSGSTIANVYGCSGQLGRAASRILRLSLTIRDFFKDHADAFRVSK
jgi:hypothetical protein